MRECCRVTACIRLQTLLQAKVILILLILYMDVNNYTLIFLLDECYTAVILPRHSAFTGDSCVAGTVVGWLG